MISVVLVGLILKLKVFLGAVSHFFSQQKLAISPRLKLD